MGLGFLVPAFLAGLKALQDHPLVGEVRGVGLVAGIELVADKAKKAPFDPKKKAGTLVMTEALARGLLVRAIGDTLVFSPPLVTSERDLAEMVSRFAQSLDAALPQLRTA